MIQVGDRVLCVDASNCVWHDHVGECHDSGLINGREYIVYDVTTCGCGQQYDVGLATEFGEDWLCDVCKGPLPSDDIMWVEAWRFRKVEERTIEYTVKVDIEILEPVLS